jgi:hypothetical protein
VPTAVTCPAGCSGAEFSASGAERLRDECGACHCDGGSERGIDLDRLLEAVRSCRPAEGSAEEAAWVAIWRNLQAETMPPADEPRPDPDTRQALVDFVLGDVLGVDPARPDPIRAGGCCGGSTGSKTPTQSAI